MIDILIAVGISLTVSILLTPMLIRLFARQGFGHEIREDGPPSHKTKRGTPSMGGVAILAGIWASYIGTHLAGLAFNGQGGIGVGDDGGFPAPRAFHDRAVVHGAHRPPRSHNNESRHI